ncbi:MAG: phospho-N-acetylmuramoyl-pentapeptide-transferase [Candidatus Cryptobacteroides sp.]|nr:phospho-N-acetylmuramoyl-pentapeptide-transferase [Candidatus Cryptobacteroides sp.]
MIYHIFEALKDFNIPGQGLMGYISFRALMACVTALMVGIFGGEKIIRRLRKLQIGEDIRDLGLQGQMEKKGTPTMGGIIILISLLAGVLLWCDLTNRFIIILIFSALWCSGIGFLDDYIKVHKHDKHGLSEKKKLILQTILGLGVALAVWYSDSDLGTTTTIPFVKNNEFDYKWLTPFTGAWEWYTKWAIYMVMITIVVVACSNGTNLNDGLDGLAGGNSAIVGVVLGIFAYLGGNVINSDYLNIMYIPHSGEIAVFMAAFTGALIAFLWYNSYPAQVFMGDTGSLMIGGVIGVCAVLIRKELLLPVLCGIFFVESLSVLVQRFYFKYTKKRTGTGKRIFKMAPLHHHFQKEGVESLIQRPKRAMHEVKITTRFWIVGIILAVLSIALLKIR